MDDRTWPPCCSSSTWLSCYQSLFQSCYCPERSSVVSCFPATSLVVNVLTSYLRVEITEAFSVIDCCRFLVVVRCYSATTNVHLSDCDPEDKLGPRSTTRGYNILANLSALCAVPLRVISPVFYTTGLGENQNQRL